MEALFRFFSPSLLVECPSWNPICLLEQRWCSRSEQHATATICSRICQSVRCVWFPALHLPAVLPWAACALSDWLRSSLSDTPPYRAAPTLAVISLCSRSIVIITVFFVNVCHFFPLPHSVCLSVCLSVCFWPSFSTGCAVMMIPSVALALTDAVMSACSRLSSSSLSLSMQCGVAVQPSTLPFSLVLSFASCLPISNYTLYVVLSIFWQQIYVQI